MRSGRIQSQVWNHGGRQKWDSPDIWRLDTVTDTMSAIVMGKGASTWEG